MKHDIFFNTKDLLIEWLDENFPDATLKHIEADSFKCSKMLATMLCTHNEGEERAVDMVYFLRSRS